MSKKYQHRTKDNEPGAKDPSVQLTSYAPSKNADETSRVEEVSTKHHLQDEIQKAGSTPVLGEFSNLAKNINNMLQEINQEEEFMHLSEEINMFEDSDDEENFMRTDWIHRDGINPMDKFMREMSDVIAQDSIARSVDSELIDDSHIFAEFHLGIDDPFDNKHVHAEFGSDHHIIGVDDSTGSSKHSETSHDPTETSRDLTATSANKHSTSSPGQTVTTPILASVELHTSQSPGSIKPFLNIDDFVGTHKRKFDKIVAKDISEKRFCCCC